MAVSSSEKDLDFRQADGCIAARRSAIQNFESSASVLESADAVAAASRPSYAVTQDDGPDWHFREWMTFFGKKQASLVNELGWEKSKASDVWHGSRPYRRPLVNEIAAFLGLQPYELLMPPAEALRLRELRDAALAIAASHTAPASDDGEGAVRSRAPQALSRRAG